MSTVCMQCVFEINGYSTAPGSICFRPNDGVDLIFHSKAGLPRGPITLKIDPSDCLDVVTFFTAAEMFSWKIPILRPRPPYRDVMCILNFSKDDKGIVIHLSLDFETEKMHMETPVDEDTLNAMPSVWRIDPE